MGLLATVKKVFARQTPGATSAQQPVSAQREPLSDPVRVPEVTARQLLDEMKGGADQQPVLLDCREHFERAQQFIPSSVHIPMNSIPTRLNELDPAQEIVVYCAHGNRSYGVAGWLIQQGYKARSLKGGIVDWEHQSGPVESGYRTTS